MSTTSTMPAKPLPGAIQSPGLPRWKVAVASASHRLALDLAGRGVDAARHVGGDHARLGVVDRRDHLVGRLARRALEARPQQRVDDHVDALQARLVELLGLGPGQLVEHRPSRRPAATRPATRAARRPRARPGAAAAPRRARRRRCCPCRTPRRSRPAGACRCTTSASPSAACSISSSDGTPRVSIAHASVARICSASSSWSSQRGRLIAEHRDGAGHAARVGQRDRDRSRRAPRRAPAAAPASRTCGGTSAAADDLDVAPTPLAQAERLRDRLLRAEARGEVHRRACARLRVRTLALGEQPLREPRAALERPLQAVDLEQVDADSGHDGATVTDG